MGRRRWWVGSASASLRLVTSAIRLGRRTTLRRRAGRRREPSRHRRDAPPHRCPQPPGRGRRCRPRRTSANPAAVRKPRAVEPPPFEGDDSDDEREEQEIEQGDRQDSSATPSFAPPVVFITGSSTIAAPTAQTTRPPIKPSSQRFPRIPGPPEQQEARAGRRWGRRRDRGHRRCDGIGTVSRTKRKNV